jgi:type I restriction-modification system DNA methylase subunit
MASRGRQARAKKAKPTKSLEQTLWDAADKMRGNLEAAEYKHVVLGLVFLKYVTDAFEARREWLEAATADPKNTDYYVPNPEKRQDIVEARDEYASENVFWIPVEARWNYLQDRAKQPDIGVLIDGAMDLIEKENPSLRGVLPKTYARAEIDKRLLGELVDLVATIGFTQVDHGADDVLGRVYEYFAASSCAAHDASTHTATSAGSGSQRRVLMATPPTVREGLSSRASRRNATSVPARRPCVHTRGPGPRSRCDPG